MEQESPQNESPKLSVSLTRLVNLQHDECEIYIGRPSKWGNPYTHIDDKETKAIHIVDSREEAITKYREYIINNKDLIDSLDELEGKILGCWCKPNTCHGDILLELLSQRKIKEFFENNTIK